MINEKVYTGNRPLLSIICITYNHEAFIASAIEGFLIQNTDFPYEIIIGEDCSTDKTLDIIKKYEQKHSNLIRVIISEENVGPLLNEIRALKAARGKYIAFCEGDDYWIDPLKLQKQVSFLESHPDFSLSCHRLKHYDVSNQTWFHERNNEIFHNGIENIEFDYKTYQRKKLELMTVTMVFKKDKLDLALVDQYSYYRDAHQFYHLLKEGKGILFSFVGAVRNIHNGGICGGKTPLGRSKDSVDIFRDLFRFNKDNDLRLDYIISLQNYIYNCRNNHKIKEQIAYSFELFITERSFSRLISNLKRTFFPKHE